MNLVRKLTAVSILFLGSIASLRAETIGTSPLSDTPGSYDGLSGGVFVFNGSPQFTVDGNAVSFDFLGDTLGKNVTPLLFLKQGTTFTVAGVGASFTSGGGIGTQTASFNLLAGSGSVTTGYTFGYFDGLVSSDGAGGVNIDSKNGGTVNTRVDGGPWVFMGTYVPEGTNLTTINPGTIFAISAASSQTGSGTVADPYNLNGDGRTYQMNMTSQVVPEPSSLILCAAGFIGVVAAAKRKRR